MAVVTKAIFPLASPAKQAGQPLCTNTSGRRGSAGAAPGAHRGAADPAVVPIRGLSIQWTGPAPIPSSIPYTPSFG